ncbi:MAG: glycosyltransferase family 4 protein [Acidobacteriales bacterium]|nr:glycosyltransferase family 4 protein [Terriglobales bacterium]
MAGKPRLRLAFIGGRGLISKYSGIETYYEQVGQRLAARGHHVTIYCRSYFTPRLKSYNGMRIVRLPTIRCRPLETLLHSLLSTVHAMCTRCDVVHYQALGPALFSFLPRIAGKKTVVTVQGLDWQRKKWGRIASAVLRLGEVAAIRFPNATIVVSRTLKQHFGSRHRRETAYVPNGAPIRSRVHPSKIGQLGLDPGNYILYLDRFSAEKNCHLLVDAYERIQTSAKLVLAGGSSHSDSYATRLRQYASNQIHILDWVSGEMLDDLLTNAMLLVLPSDIEGLSLVLLEAMGAGVCVLASDIPENRELVEQVGFVFKHGDVHDLERMLRSLIHDPAARLASSGRGREMVRQHYSWDAITSAVEEVHHAVRTGSKVEKIIPAVAALHVESASQKATGT